MTGRDERLIFRTDGRSGEPAVDRGWFRAVGGGRVLAVFHAGWRGFVAPKRGRREVSSVEVASSGRWLGPVEERGGGVEWQRRVGGRSGRQRWQHA